MNAFAHDLAWVAAGAVGLVLTLDVVAMIRRSRTWKRTARAQRGAELRREWRGR